MKSFLMVFLLSLSAFATTYNYTTLQYPGALGTYPSSVNKGGVVVGSYLDSNYSGHGFTYTNGVFASVDAGSNCYETFVTGINDAGTLSGYCFANQGGTLDFVYSNGSFTFYGLPTVLDSYSSRINNAGVSVGWFFTNQNTVASFYKKPGKNPVEFTAPTAPNATAAYGINNQGTIVGNGINGTSLQEGFIDQKNVFTFYSHPGSYNTFFNGVNDSNQVVGDYSQVARGPVFAFLFENGTFTDLQITNATGSVAEGINDSGVIVGYYVTGSSPIQYYASGFIATPHR